MVHVFVGSISHGIDEGLGLCQLSVKDALDFAQLYRVYNKEALTIDGNQTRLQQKREATDCGNCCLPGAPGPSGRPGRNGRPVRIGHESFSNR